MESMRGPGQVTGVSPPGTHPVAAFARTRVAVPDPRSGERGYGPTSLTVPFVALWLYFLFFHGLGRRDLWNSHEARAAMNARSVLEDGRWLLPHLHDGHAELQKPPLYYWLV